VNPHVICHLPVDTQQRKLRLDIVYRLDHGKHTALVL
jgi:hypothetical protein